MYSPHMLTPHDMQDAQEDAIRTWVPPHFPSNLSLRVHKQLYVPLSGHTYTPPTRAQLPCEKYLKGVRLEDGFMCYIRQYNTVCCIAVTQAYRLWVHNTSRICIVLLLPAMYICVKFYINIRVLVQG